MKLLHTSDWHLGQHFMGKSRQPEHQQFLRWLIELAVDKQVTAILVAGDIFDTGSPPSYARELYNQFIVDLLPTGIQLIILGGNHDSVATLNESKALLAQLNTHVIPNALENRDDQVLTLSSLDKSPVAIVCAVPFLRPRDLLFSHEGQSGSDKQQQLQQAIADHYQSLYDKALAVQKEVQTETGKCLPIIATGHLTTVGAKTSESVRDIYIGTLDALPASAFPPAAYIALGHIHRPQKVGGTEHIRYSGSPIPLSFDELKQDKTVLLVEFEGADLKQVASHIVPRFQPMYLIKGTLQDIEVQIAELDSPDGLTAWLDIEVSTQDYLNDLQPRIQKMIEDKPFEVLMLRRARSQKLQGIEAVAQESLNELSPKEVFERRLAKEEWTGDDLEAKRERLSLAFDDVISFIQNDQQGTMAL